MGLFAIDTEYVGPGLPLWLPKGTAIVEEPRKLAKRKLNSPPATCACQNASHRPGGENVFNPAGISQFFTRDSMFLPMTLLEEQERGAL